MKKPTDNIFVQNRRSFLKTVLGAGITNGLLRASPLVGGMMLARAAEASDVPNKQVSIYVPGGAINKFWQPDENYILPSMSAAYEPVKDEIVFLRNMGITHGGHGSMGRIFNNSWSKDSFEVNMGRVLGADTSFPYINLGVMSNGFGQITKDAGSDVNFEDNPFVVFNRLFGNGSSGSGGPSLRLNVVDAHKEALDALQAKLGAHEKQRLDKHLTAIEETESRLVNNGGGSCSAAGTAPTEYPLTAETFTQQAHLQADILALALSCNLTRSASIGFGNHQGEFSVAELNYDGIYHQSIHGGQGGSNYSHYQEFRGYLSGLSAYVIEKLKSEGLLDKTVVVELSDMGHADSHAKINVPNLIAGGGSSIIKGNRPAGGAAYNNLHVVHTAAAALGATGSPLYQGYANQVIPGILG
jgi:hypothetical protein